MSLELEEIRKEDEAEKAEGFISVWKLFTLRSLRWQLISTIVLMAGQQLSGVNAVRAAWAAHQLGEAESSVRLGAHDDSPTYL